MSDNMVTDKSLSPAGADRRAFKRALGLLSGCLMQSGKPVNCAVLDLSLQGAKIEIDRPLRATNPTMLRLTSKLRIAAPLDLTVEVVWESATRAGLRFLDAPHEVALALAGVLPEDCLKLSPDP